MASVFNSGVTSLMLAAFATCVGAADKAAPSGEAVAPPETVAPATAEPDDEDTGGPERLKKEIRVVVETNAPPAAGIATTAPPQKEKSFRWKFSWEGWDGLYVEAAQRTRLETQTSVMWQMGIDTNAVPIIHLEKVKLSGRFGARLDVDGAVFATTGDLTGFDDGVQIRRLRFRASGDCILLLPVSYYIELGLDGTQFNLQKCYLVFPEVRLIGDLQIGQFQPPMGLQLITSSRDITFMEPAAPLQAIAPGVEVGGQFGRPFLDERATWAFGLFAPGAGDIEYGNASQDYGSAILRFTGLPIWHVDPADLSADRYLHVGLSANVLYSATSTVRYQSRPESHIAPFVIDTGDIDANGAVTLGTEAAWVHGPVSAQGEFMYSRVEPSRGDALTFYGFYAQGSWYLTGESRPYDRKTGAFKRLIPRHNFDFGKTGWGAFEVACRYSYTDLTDGGVNGGRLGLLMASANWYPHSHVRWMFNYGMGRVRGGAEDGNLFIFQTRIGVDF